MRFKAFIAQNVLELEKMLNDFAREIMHDGYEDTEGLPSVIYDVVWEIPLFSGNVHALVTYGPEVDEE